MSNSKNIFSQQCPELIRVFEHAGSAAKVLCVPIDYAKDTHMALCCNGQGTILKKAFAVHNTPGGVEHLQEAIAAISKKHNIAKEHVVIGGEDCGTFADNFIHQMITDGYRIFRTNAHRAKSLRENMKASTDALDLLGIAGVFLNRQGKSVRVNDVEHLRFLTRHRHGLTQESTAVGNRIHAICDQLFPGFLMSQKSGVPAFGDACLDLMSASFSPQQIARRRLHSLSSQLRRHGIQRPDEVARQLQHYAKTVLPAVPSRVEALQYMLADQVKQLSVLQGSIASAETVIGNELARQDGALATSMRGTGIVLASQLAGELADGIRTIPTEQICSYAGIVPGTQQSGGPEKPAVSTGVPRNYNHFLKDTVMQLAQHLGRHGPDELMSDYARRKMNQQNAEFGMARRYVRIYRAMVRDGAIYLPPHLRHAHASGQDRANYYLDMWPRLVRKWARVGAAKAAFDVNNPLGAWRNCVEELYGIKLPLHIKEPAKKREKTAS